MVIACIDDEIDLCGALRSLDCLEHGVDSEVTSGLTLSEIRQIGVDLDVGNGHLSSGCPIEDPADMLITLVTHDSGGSDHRAHVSPGIGDLLEAILIGAMVIACIDDEIDLCSALGRLGLAIDGIEGQIALLVLIVPAVFLGYQRSQRVEVIRSAIQGTIYRIEFPSGDGLITVLDRRSRTVSGGNCLRGSNWGLIIRSAEADLDRPAELRRSLLIIGLIVVVLVLGPGGVDRNVGICEGHIALQKRHIGRFLRRRSGGSIAVLSVRPSQEDNPVVLGAKRITTLQSGRIAGIVLVRIGNSTSRAIGIVGQCVRFLLVVRDLVAVVIDRIVHIKDLLIRVPDGIHAGFLGVQHVGVLGIISSKLIGALVTDPLLADFLSSLRIHRIRLSYISLRIYPEVVDGVAVLCLNGRSEGTLCHVDGCNQFSVELLERNGPIRKIYSNRV